MAGKKDLIRLRKRKRRKQNIIRATIHFFVWAVAVLYYIGFSVFFDTPVEYELKHSTDRLRREYTALVQRYDTLTTVMRNLSERDRNVFRILFETDPYDFDSEYERKQAATYENIFNRSSRRLKRELRERVAEMETRLDELNATSDNTMVAHLGIVYTRLGDDVLEAEMPVDNRTHQPFGLLHGGASAALAETLGSMAGFMMTRDGQCVVGTELNATHHRPVSEGKVRGVCQPLHLGRQNQSWEIVVFDEQGRRCCTCRLGTAVLG